MRQKFTGTIRSVPNSSGYISLHVGSLSADERAYLRNSTVEIRKVDTAESLLDELAKEIDAVVGRGVLQWERDTRVKDILSRIKELRGG